MSSKEYTVNESLEEGLNHGNPGRSPERPGEYTSTSLAEFYDEDEPTPAEEGAGFIDGILTSKPAIVGSGVAAGGEVINLLYDPVDLPVISQYPEAVAGAAVVGGGILIYNAASETAKYVHGLLEEDEVEEVTLDDYHDLGTVDGVEDAEERAEATERHFEQLAEDFDPEEAEILTPELEEDLSQMPGSLDA